MIERVTGSELGRSAESAERLGVDKVAIVVMGRGIHIEADKILKKRDIASQEELIQAVRSGRTDLLKPTHLLEAVKPNRNYRQGDFGPEQHPAFGWKVRRGTNEPKFSRYAGAEVNVRAAAKICDEVIDGGGIPIVYFAAGLTPDMKEYAPKGWSQGRVLAEYFLGIASDKVVNSGMLLALEPENANSWDDIVASYTDATERGVDKIVTVTVGIHVKRTYLMGEEVRTGMAQHMGDGESLPGMHIVASESVLRDDPAMWRDIRKAISSRGHDITLAREQRGIQAMKNGSYQSQWTDGGKVAEFNKPVQTMTVDELLAFK
jgi:hypothetical protein